MPLASRLQGDTFRFLASTDGTAVSVNGAMVANLDRGQFYEQIVSGPVQITANQPILVAQYSNGITYDRITDELADPFMMLIPPTEQFLANYTVATAPRGFLNTLSARCLWGSRGRSLVRPSEEDDLHKTNRCQAVQEFAC
jgi:hypothetical protein